MPTNTQNSEKNHLVIDFRVDEGEHGRRLDQVLAERVDGVSRGRLQQSLKEGDILCNDKKAKPKTSVCLGDKISGAVWCEVQVAHAPQAIALDVLYHDQDIIVLNKPAGMVVHPAAGNHDGTLLNALLHYFPSTAELPRAGIVHRLDKDTSGLLVVAHSLRAHTHLVEQLQERTMGRTYLALVHRYVTAGDTIDEPIGRHRSERVKMAVRSDGKAARTHYRIEERFDGVTLLRVQLESGRTHQIRVHMAHIHHPLVGDKVYGAQAHVPKGMSEVAREAVQQFPRQALHAAELHLTHPGSGETMTFSAPLPDDFTALLDVLRVEQEA
ncbi:23S rRNA pseudouridine(1911/1915/1917) synthase RluD [Suttonella sp. R2A3]|uniref:23S rRNA pseudouridine(1911/1915/1917) synthase RluD n=1 Tax=Suttonella sp. R2A3 TaxID=2908648 RepID=UPI001F3609D2|nr:23S rRNA pseudouridine(1911/1915/1917) synthase RluD [Suttonella sp. R2A3]UJF24163.1 23S rRNA pseudouridine(1911/1915/1917) synthase RluD [Suttonella sp. R2A3]